MDEVLKKLEVLAVEGPAGTFSDIDAAVVVAASALNYIMDNLEVTDDGQESEDTDQGS